MVDGVTLEAEVTIVEVEATTAVAAFGEEGGEDSDDVLIVRKVDDVMEAAMLGLVMVRVVMKAKVVDTGEEVMIDDMAGNAEVVVARLAVVVEVAAPEVGGMAEDGAVFDIETVLAEKSVESTEVGAKTKVGVEVYFEVSIEVNEMTSLDVRAMVDSAVDADEDGVMIVMVALRAVVPVELKVLPLGAAAGNTVVIASIVNEPSVAVPRIDAITVCSARLLLVSSVEEAVGVTLLEIGGIVDDSESTSVVVRRNVDVP